MWIELFSNPPFFASAVILLIGLSVVLRRRNLIKILMGLTLVESAVNLFLVATGYRTGGIAPIYTSAEAGARMVLPTVQALTLTAIVIGLATTAMMLSFVIILYRHTGTLDVNKARKLRE